MINKKIKDIIAKKNKSKIVSLTAYSKNIAQIIDKYVDMTLVGDSMASVLYNYNTTRKISLDAMIEHAKSVRMGVHNSLMVFDMPYNTYKDKKNALLNAKKIIKKTKSDAVKLEGGSKIKDIVKHLIKNKIPVLGHLGIMPQSVRGKFKSKGKTVNKDGEEVDIEVTGRHDPCVGIRAVPIAEAMVSLVLVDHLLINQAQCSEVKQELPFSE